MRVLPPGSSRRPTKSRPSPRSSTTTAAGPSGDPHSPDVHFYGTRQPLLRASLAHVNAGAPNALRTSADTARVSTAGRSVRENSQTLLGLMMVSTDPDSPVSLAVRFRTKPGTITPVRPAPRTWRA